MRERQDRERRGGSNGFMCKRQQLLTEMDAELDIKVNYKLNEINK